MTEFIKRAPTQLEMIMDACRIYDINLSFVKEGKQFGILFNGQLIRSDQDKKLVFPNMEAATTFASQVITTEIHKRMNLE